MKYLFLKFRIYLSKYKKIAQDKSLNLFSTNFLASLYYFIFSPKFYREHRAVLEGKRKFYQDLKYNESIYAFRQNIHRLEKGLSAHLRKTVFFKDSIMKTIMLFQKFNTEKSSKYENDLFWAHNVLSKYFSVVANDNVINKAKEIFFSIPNIAEFEDRSLSPFLRSINEPSQVNYEELLSLSRRRRAVRRYLDVEVPREIIDKALVIAGLAPSGCNRQPYRYLILDNKNNIQKISDNLLKGLYNYTDNIPCVAFLVGDLSAFSDDRHRHIIYIDSSLSAMSFMYALETLGLSSCPLNWTDIKEREEFIEKELQLKKYERVIMMISFGYPDPIGKVPFSQKKNSEDIRAYVSES